MKKILGLDLGTTSIGWAYVYEAEKEHEKTEIKKIGVRVIPLTTDEETDFQKGKATSINADRTLKRGARRNLDRYQLRRKALIEILKKNKFISDNSTLSEEGKDNTFLTYKLRAEAAKNIIEKKDLARVLLMINKKRGYKSSRKAKSEEEGTAIDGMAIAKELYENNLTPGQYVYNLLNSGKKYITDFYRSDLKNELNRIWTFQKQFHADILTDEFKEQIKDKGKQATSKIFLGKYQIFTAENKGKRDEVKLQSYKWRTEALSQQLSKEEIAYVIVEINNNINSSSGYLGAISDRSKELYFNNFTVGEYLYNQLKTNPHAKLKNQVFYRQDYMDELERIWETQKQFYPELTDELKIEIRDVVIFYQRRLKSQKHLISECEFEKYHKAIPKSSPLFQEFKIWSYINNIELKYIPERTKIKNIDIELKEKLFEELNIREKMSASDILKVIIDKPNDYELNYKNGLDGNKTNAELYKVYCEILKLENESFDFNKLSAEEINNQISSKFAELGIEQEVLLLNSTLNGNEFDKQPLMQLWHLLYSFEGDNSRTGDENLVKAIKEKFGFKQEYAKLIANISLKDDYGSLSTKAIRKILPGLKDGNTYDVACTYAGYNHSSSLTKEEREKRELKDVLELLPKNSLRNPVVEKILNQLVNVINAIIKDDELGKPDEIRIELSRDLKNSASERADMTNNINKANTEHDKIRQELAKLHPFSQGVRITKNDIVKYKLYKELEPLGHKTIYTNTYVSLEKLFSKEFDIEHIIPKAMLFDDSFSNKTLATRDFNSREKSNKTGIDAIIEKYGENSEDYNRYIENAKILLKEDKIKKSKYNKLLMKGTELPDGFIERDLRNSQYIAKKAKQMLEEVVRTVNTTTGSITSRLREDWQLINVLQELNWDKYNKLGLTYYEKSKDGKDIPKITDWTKRNDHRHHAMDALTVAFTRYEHVQYLNNMSARKNETHKKYHEVYGIEQKYLHKENGKFLFNPPLPITKLRAEAKKHLENILVSFKAKNKVFTRNKNKIKGKEEPKIELTPRGQLHKETVYGKIEQYVTKEEKVGTTFDLVKINSVANKKYREALLKRLEEFGGDSKKAFGGKNSPAKNPILINIVGVTQSHTDNAEFVPEKVKLVWTEPQYTIRKEITSDLKIERVIDVGIKRILQKRLDKYNGDAKKAFVNLEENPIWLIEPKEKGEWQDKNNPKPHELGIAIKRVTITGVNNVEALHYKKDHNGKAILDNEGKKQAVDFVSTGNNHHVAIYKDAKGNLQEEVVSFYEAVARVNTEQPIIWKKHPEHPDWEFQFTMKQNEYFVFPANDFNPEEHLLNPENTSLISKHLFRVQKISNKNYVFRHHLETNVEEKKELKNVSFINIRSANGVNAIVKVRINHLGQIVKVGEY
ncbi:MAG: type II CRISPR RNA-guided endonuclease Cas9 [Bacteroidales bacterium]|nr:type II CRISPR RNA-guided endonuclease Cas9 [Bacteroidales bacterium]